MTRTKTSATQRIKKALDLIGDLLLEGGLNDSQLQGIEKGLMHAVMLGQCERPFRFSVAQRGLDDICARWQEAERTAQIKKLRMQGGK